jgi:hypothetical protein
MRCYPVNTRIDHVANDECSAPVKLAEVSEPVVRQNEIVSSHEVKSRANLSRPVVVAAQWVNQHEIMLGFEAVQESILT